MRFPTQTWREVESSYQFTQRFSQKLEFCYEFGTNFLLPLNWRTYRCQDECETRILLRIQNALSPKNNYGSFSLE
jgi:hypothetical protein